LQRRLVDGRLEGHVRGMGGVSFGGVRLEQRGRSKDQGLRTRDNRASYRILEQIESRPPMSMKKTDIVKNLAKKLDGRMKASVVPDRFAQGAADALDKREQRRRDSAAGLVPFACKLPSALLKRLNDRAVAHEGGINAIVAAAIEKALA
jgi:hypothetical protein